MVCHVRWRTINQRFAHRHRLPGKQAGRQPGRISASVRGPKGKQLQIYLYLFIVLPNVAQPFRQATFSLFSQRESGRVAWRSLAHETNGSETKRERESKRHTHRLMLRLRLRQHNRVLFLGRRRMSNVEGEGEGDWRLSSELHHNLAVNTHSLTGTHTYTLCSCEAFFGLSCPKLRQLWQLRITCSRCCRAWLLRTHC